MKSIFEKDLSGEMVSPNEPGYDALIDDIFATIKIATEMNTGYRTPEEVHEYMGKILGKPLEESTTVLPPLYIDYGKPVTIGKGCFIQQCCTFFGRGGITIGDEVFIGPKVNLITINHDPDPENRNATYGRPIIIEDKVWIGINSTVLPGVRIGYGAIIGGGSVVTKDVPPMTVVAGNPSIPSKDASPRQKPEKLPPKGYMPHVPNAGPSCSPWPTVEKACSTSCLQPVTENVSPSVPTTR